MAPLQGRHAMVTGGGRGIGRAAAALMQAGATVTVVGRGEAALQEAVGKGEATDYGIADVTDESALAAQFERAAKSRGPIDILIANAGGAPSPPPSRRPPPWSFAGYSSSM